MFCIRTCTAHDPSASADFVACCWLQAITPVVSHSPSTFIHSTNPQTATIYLDLAATLVGAPLACCFEILGAWPDAVLEAVLAFSAFFLLSAVAFFSLPSLMAACRAAARASGRIVRRSLITSRDAPTMARWCLTVRRVLFFATSCCECQFSALVVWYTLGAGNASQYAPELVVVPLRYPFGAVYGRE